MPDTNRFVSIGAKIKDLRTQAGLTQAEFASALKCSVPYLSYIENGRKGVSFDIFVRILEYFDMSADDFLDSTGPGTFDPYIASISVQLQNCTEKEKRLFLELLKICKQLMGQA